MNTLKHGYLITLEGIEGSGKSSHACFIAQQLEKTGHNVLLTREPGGTSLGEKIREILLNTEPIQIYPEIELLLMFAARAQHIQQILIPAINAGKIVVCDRFIDSSYAYQGGGRGIPIERIQQLENWMFSTLPTTLKPHLTLLLDVSVESGLARINTRKIKTDRIEAETLDFFKKVKNAFLDIAYNDIERVYILDAEQDYDNVQAEILHILQKKGLC